MLLLLDSEVIIIALRPMEYSTTVLRKVSELSSPMPIDCSLDKKYNISTNNNNSYSNVIVIANLKFSTLLFMITTVSWYIRKPYSISPVYV